MRKNCAVWRKNCVIAFVISFITALCIILSSCAWGTGPAKPADAAQTAGVSAPGTGEPHETSPIPTANPFPSWEGLVPEFEADTNTDGIIIDSTLAYALRVSEGLSENEILTKERLAGIYSIYFYDKPITSLIGIEYMTGLRYFDCGHTYITDLSPLLSLDGLKSFSIWSGLISDVPDLSSMTSLTRLTLSSNLISDVSPFLTAPSLTNLSLDSNLIHSIAPLAASDTLEALYINNNCVTDFSAVSESRVIREALAYSDIDLDKCLEAERIARGIADEICAGSTNELEKEYAIYRYVIDTMEYEVIYGMLQPFAYNALTLNRGVCGDYAEAFALIARHAGLDANVVISDTHAWNIVKINGKWYHVDTLWDDAIKMPEFFNRGSEFILSCADHGFNLLRTPASVDMDISEYAYLLPDITY